MIKCVRKIIFLLHLKIEKKERVSDLRCYTDHNCLPDIFLFRYIHVFIDCQFDLKIPFFFLLINTTTSLLIVINNQYVIFLIQIRRLYIQILFFFLCIQLFQYIMAQMITLNINIAQTSVNNFLFRMFHLEILNTYIRHKRKR